MGDDGGGLEHGSQRPEVVADPHQVDHPDDAIHPSQGEEPDFPEPRVQCVSFFRAVGLEIERDEFLASQLPGETGIPSLIVDISQTGLAASLDEKSLYYTAIMQLPQEPIEDVSV